MPSLARLEYFGDEMPRFVFEPDAGNQSENLPVILRYFRRTGMGHFGVADRRL